jgi:hypothetical protein
VGSVVVHDPWGVGIDWSGAVTGALQQRTEGATDYRVCAQDGYCGGWIVMSHFWVGSLSIDDLLLGLCPHIEGAGALKPRPPRQ